MPEDEEEEEEEELIPGYGKEEEEADDWISKLPHHGTGNDTLSLLPPPSARRLWVGLKYHLNSPVLRSINMVSKPTRRYWLNCTDLDAVSKGQQVGHVKGMKGVGESLYLTSDRGVMEIREAVRRRVGGMVLCRVNKY